MAYSRNPREKKRDGIKREFYRLPADLAPAGVDCVNLLIPDDPEYRELFMTAIWSLTRWYHYERTGTNAGAVVAGHFKTAYETIVFECQEEEDTLADDFADLIDGVISQFQEGGIIRAIGYVINELGSIVVETALRYVAVTVIGTALGGVVSILIGGVVLDTVAVAGGEVVELIFDSGDFDPKIIEFVFDAAA